ncbi:family 20 glycosylhydrolase [Dongshaea marina]|uniref:family 20 glycosylhydrolase n=1 Tax=Dongshaea marina TaxID=2047966 RepID=UPI00131F14F2|nr:family 20 glycosylhydrolase [Dongshaea marina]
MNARTWLVIFVIAGTLLLTACRPPSSSLSQPSQLTTQQQLDYIGEHLKLHYELVNNFSDPGKSHRLDLWLENRGNQVIREGDWRLYLQSVQPILSVDSSLFRVKHLKGTLNRLTPSSGFELKPGETVKLPLTSSFWQISYSDFMPRAYVSAPQMQPRVIANTQVPLSGLEDDPLRYVDPITEPQQYKRTPQDRYHPFTALELYQQNDSLHQLPSAEVSSHIIPTPLSVKLTNLAQPVTLDKSWVIRYQKGLENEANYLAEQLEPLLGVKLRRVPGYYRRNVPRSIDLMVGPVRLSPKEGSLVQHEAYTLRTSLYQVAISGASSHGVFNGIESLMALVPGTSYLSPKGEVSLPQLKVRDAPRMAFRGLLLDVARNFQPPVEVKKVIDMMAALKLNRLHLHLSDDEGWRLAIPELPELTQVGGRRCHDLAEQRCLLPQLGSDPAFDSKDSGTGFYTQAQFIELLHYAWARHIQVIPEFDMPGHARAAIIAMKARYQHYMALKQPQKAREFLLSDPGDSSRYLSVQGYDDNALNVCLASTRSFIKTLINSVQATYRKAGVPLHYWHMGNDEVADGAWTGSPACHNLYPDLSPENPERYRELLTENFVAFISRSLAEYGVVMGSWNDGMKQDESHYIPRDKLKSKVYVNAWDATAWPPVTSPRKLSDAGYKVVLSLPSQLYFDHPYAPDPRERGFYWASRYTDSREVFAFTPSQLKGVRESMPNGELGRVGINGEGRVSKWNNLSASPQYLLGVLAGAWSETIRTPAQLDYMLFPRAIALAERAWHRPSWESSWPNPAQRLKDWQAFANSVALNWMPRMAAADVMFRLPPPGGKLTRGKLFANSPYPGLAIQYDAGKGWIDYPPAGVENEKAPIRLRSVILRQGKVIRASRESEIETK